MVSNRLQMTSNLATMGRYVVDKHIDQTFRERFSGIVCFRCGNTEHFRSSLCAIYFANHAAGEPLVAAYSHVLISQDSTSMYVHKWSCFSFNV